MGTQFYIHPDTEVAQVVLENPHFILFLEHFNINTPLKSKTVAEICQQYQISEALFIAIGNLYLHHEVADSTAITVSDLPSIIQFLNNTHRYYLDDIYPKIERAIQEIQQLNDSKEIALLERFFKLYFNEVREHLNYELEVAHPYIEQLYQAASDTKIDPNMMTYSVNDYVEHHDDIEEKLDDLMNLLVKYLPYQKDFHIRRSLFLNLVELDYDLKIHSKIEEQILIPLAQNVEQTIKRKA